MSRSVEQLLPADLELPELLDCGDAEHPLLRRLLWGAGALVCFALGVVGWLVPIVTGIPFYVAGLVMLAKAVPPVGRWVNDWDRRQPLTRRLWLRPRLRARLLREAEARRDAGDAPPGGAPEGGERR